MKAPEDELQGCLQKSTQWARGPERTPKMATPTFYTYNALREALNERLGRTLAPDAFKKVVEASNVSPCGRLGGMEKRDDRLFDEAALTTLAETAPSVVQQRAKKGEGAAAKVALVKGVTSSDLERALAYIAAHKGHSDS